MILIKYIKKAPAIIYINISSIIFSLVTRVVEGFFGCTFDFNIKSEKGKSQKKLLCNNSTIGSTKLRQSDFQTNLGKLIALATKTKTLVLAGILLPSSHALGIHPESLGITIYELFVNVINLVPVEVNLTKSWSRCADPRHEIRASIRLRYLATFFKWY